MDMKPSTRLELGDHPLSRAISAHHQAVRALGALDQLVGLWRREHPTYAERARSVRLQVASLEERAKILRRRAEAEGLGELL